MKGDRLLERLKKVKLSAEDRYFFRKYGSLVSNMRRDSILQCRLLHGIVIPPHERVMLRVIRWPQFDEYHFVGGRGTSKTATVCSVAPVLYAEVYGRKKLSSLSASKFRGGKIIMEEALSFILGTWDSQKMPGPFAPNMMVWSKGVKREADRWYIPFTTNTNFITVPTGNEETARGLRANLLFLDEADNWTKDSVDRIFGPFLAVRSNFEAPGKTGFNNKIFFTGTVSYSHKDWAKALIDRENMIRKAHEAQKALMAGDFKMWNAMLEEDNDRLFHFSSSFQRWDYLDLIISTEFKEHDVFYPSIDRMTNSVDINSPDLIQYDKRDKKNYIYTYPVDKNQAESQLDDGLTDFDTWSAEWRCQFIETSGNIFPFDLIETCTTKELFSREQLLSHGWDVEELGVYGPPVLYSCDDPCVLGIDPARTSDFTAFVVIRLGELAEGVYDPMTGTGQTPWNNVIWAEQRKQMTIKDISKKIRHLKYRYNLVVSPNPEKAPGAIIDARGAASGTTIRDELALPSPDTDEFGNVDPNWVMPDPLYDPTDKEYPELRTSSKSWPGLRLLWTTDQINTELVSFSQGQLQVAKLYIGKYLNSRERNDPEHKLDLGYMGCKVLKDQLLAIQGKPTKHAYTYMMPGDSRRDSMKKDMFSAFLYAIYGLKQHQSMLVRNVRKTPVAAAVVVDTRKRKLSFDTSYMRYE